MSWNIVVAFIFLGLQYADAACAGEIPLSAGTWKTNSQGTWTIPSSRDSIQNYRVKHKKTEPEKLLTMNCIDNRTDGYILFKSLEVVPLFSTVSGNVFVCIKFEQQSTSNEDAFYFYLGSGETTDIDADGNIAVYERFILSSSSVDFSTQCSDTSTSGERANVAIKNGAEANAAIECPSSLIGTLSYNGTSCDSTHLDVCTTRSIFNYNYTVCLEKQMFSDDGQLHCVLSTSGTGYNYVTLYNRDSSVDSSTTFQFTCMVYSVSGSTVTASIQPGQCYDPTYQTPTDTKHSNGVLRILINHGSTSCYPTEVSPTSSSEFPWIYIVIAIAVIILIVIIILIIYCCLKRKRKKKQPDEESIASSVDEGVVEDQSVMDEKEKEEQTERDAQILEQDEKEKDKEKRRNSIDSGIQQDDKKMDGPGDKDEKKDDDPNDEETKVLTKEDRTENKEKTEIQNNEKELEKNESNEQEETKVVIVQPVKETSKDEEDKSDSETQIEKKEESDNNSGTESDEDIDDENDITNDQNQRDTHINNSTDNVSHKSVKRSKEEIDDKKDEQKEESGEEKQGTKDVKDKVEKEKTINTEDTDAEETKTTRSEEEPEEQVDDKRKNVDENENKQDENHPIMQIKKTDEIPVKRIEVQEKEKEDQENEDTDKDDDEERSEGSAKSRRSSRGSSDASEIERNLQMVGMKKHSKYQPQGELSKVLVSREMEEKRRMSKEKGKWKKMKQLFKGKTKKVKDSNRQKDDGRGTQDLFDDEFFNGKNIVPFMQQYQYKKQMDHRFEEEHEREEDRQKRRRDKQADMYSDSEDDDFAGIFSESDEEINEDEKTKEQKMNEENKRMKNLKEEDGITEEEKRQAKHLKNKQDKDKLGTEEADERKQKQKSDENAKDSGVDSPELKKENSDLNESENEEYDKFEMIELPPGYIRDTNGQIIRVEDGEVVDDEELKSIFRLAKLGVIFHVPRLKRTSNGRPTGGYVTDQFGPKKEKDKTLNGDTRTDHSKPKHPRSSRASGRNDHRDLFQQKSVAFDMNDEFADILMDDDKNDTFNDKDPSLENRELLKKRLFRCKRKRGLDNRLYQSEDGPPRELNDLVRVIPQGQGHRYQSNGLPLPGTVLSRNDSLKNKFDPEQQQMYRDGLATDRRILEQSPSMQRRPGAPKEAFMNGDDTDDSRERLQNEENEERQRRLGSGGVHIGSDDEFFLVGSRQEKPEPLFTHVRRPGEGNGKPTGSFDGFYISHDMRHAMPWSLLNKNPVRESSISDININRKGPKSADAKRDLDDRRLKELLEELYTDKKYFDHVIHTTDPLLEPIIDERDLATHGRDFLLERAEYWEERGVKIPRPPMTALGLRLSRQFTTMPDSGRVSNISYASTATPQPHPFQASDSQELQSPQAFVNRENTVP